MTWGFGRFATVCSVVWTVALGGCGKDLYQAAPVTGTVLCDGKPAWGGTIVFQPIDDSATTGRPKGEPGLSSSGVVGEDGTFSLMVEARGADPSRAGALIGPHHVFFRAPRTEPWEVEPGDLSLPPQELERLKEDLAKRPVYKPLDCGTGIKPDTVDVSSGKNRFEFTLLPPTPESAAAKPRKRNYGDTFQHAKSAPSKE